MKISNFHLNKFIIFLLVITLSTASIGCSGQKKEIQRLFLVLAVGIDTMPDDRVQVTMQILNPSASSAQSGDVSGPSPKDIIDVWNWRHIF
jgi:spore germination protein KC